MFPPLNAYSFDGKSDMPLSAFGPFAHVFAKGELSVPGHLELLGLRGGGVQIVLGRIEEAIAAGDPSPWLVALLADSNWRPHLVGALALVLGAGTPSDIELLWRAADCGSWVVPQLVAAALFVDADFPSRARSRVDTLCPVRVPAGLLPAERHSATGPGNTRSRSAKLLGSLVAIGEQVPSLAAWLTRVRAEPETVALLAEDLDDGASIANRWREQLVAQFAHRGRHLEPKAG